MTKLRQKMIRAMELRNLSNHSQRAYLAAVTGIAKHYRQSPDKITNKMIEDYLFNAKALSLVFRGKFIERMSHACLNEKINLTGNAYKNLKMQFFAEIPKGRARPPDHLSCAAS